MAFTSDNRQDLADVTVPTLVLQCSEDIIASQEVGEFVNRTLPNSRMIVLKATGHCPNLSAPEEVIAAMRTFVVSTTGPDFQDMIENAPCGYITLHASGRVDHVNQTFLEWSGHAADQMVGKRFSDFLTMPGRIYYETHIAPLLRMQGFFNEFAIDMVTAGGEPLQMIANANERRDLDGKLLLIRLALIKATDRRRYEQELLAARELSMAAEKATQEVLRLEHETSELREQFIAVLGHDLRNPLASISAGARILDRTVQSEKEHQIIAMMQTTVMRMASMIDNVLDFARGRLGGGITLERDAARPLEPVLAQVVDELRLASPGRVIEADFEIERPVNCDASASASYSRTCSATR